MTKTIYKYGVVGTKIDVKQEKFYPRHKQLEEFDEYHHFKNLPAGDQTLEQQLIVKKENKALKKIGRKIYEKD